MVIGVLTFPIPDTITIFKGENGIKSSNIRVIVVLGVLTCLKYSSFDKNEMENQTKSGFWKPLFIRLVSTNIGVSLLYRLWVFPVR